MSFEPICITPEAEIDASELITIRIPDFLQKASQPETPPLQKKGALRLATGVALSGLKGFSKFAFGAVATPYASAFFFMTGTLGLATTVFYPTLVEDFGARSDWSTSVRYQIEDSTSGEIHECAVGAETSYVNNYDAAESCATYVRNSNLTNLNLHMSYSLSNKNIRGMTNLGDTHGHYGAPYDGGSRTFTDISRDDALGEIESFQMAALENDGKLVLTPSNLDYYRYNAYITIPRWASNSVSSIGYRITNHFEEVRNGFAGWLEELAGSVRPDYNEDVGLEISAEPTQNQGLSNAPS